MPKERWQESSVVGSDIAIALSNNHLGSWLEAFQNYHRDHPGVSRLAFNQSVYRFKRRLLREVVWICTATDLEDTPLAARESICAYFAAALFLLRNGHSEAGKGVLQYAVSIAKRYQESALLSECLKELIKRAAYENDIRSYRRWSKQLSVAKVQCNIHAEIEHAYSSCMLALHESVPATSLAKLTVAVNHLRSYDWDTVPYPALLQLWRCQIWYLQYAGEYDTLVKTSKLVLSWYSRNPVFATTSRLIEFRTNELTGLLLNRQTHKAWRLVQTIKQTATATDSSWLSFVESFLVHSLLNSDLKHSIHAYVLYERSETKRLSAALRQKWIFYRVCLRFLADFERCTFPADSSLQKSIYPKTLHNQMSELCVSTLPYGITVEIIYLLTLMRLGRLEEVVQRESYVKRQLLRKLRAGESLQQFRCILEALLCVVRSDFTLRAMDGVNKWEKRCPIAHKHNVAEMSVIPPATYFEIIKEWLIRHNQTKV